MAKVSRCRVLLLTGKGHRHLASSEILLRETANERLRSFSDRIFVATLFTSDTDKIMRYTDEVRSFEAAQRHRDTC